MHASLQLTSADVASVVGTEVNRGLSASPKNLSPWLFYDAEGSRLFEEITALPEYYLTRTERQILLEHADAMLSSIVLAGVAVVGGHARELAMIELGAGTATKTGLLLAAAVRRQGHVTYTPIDVSKTALDEARHRLEAEIPGVKVSPKVADYTDGLGSLPCRGEQRLILYIGSSIGNFDSEDAKTLLRQVRQQLAPGDCLLLGTDLVKPAADLLAAYNDSSGVTSAFNKNVLTRINRELDADFDLELFRHRAIWNPSGCRIEMHLQSLRSQRIAIQAIDLEVEFVRGETIHTENSYKFTPDSIAELLVAANLDPVRQWMDIDSRFAVTLASVA